MSSKNWLETLTCRDVDGDGNDDRDGKGDGDEHGDGDWDGGEDRDGDAWKSLLVL